MANRCTNLAEEKVVELHQQSIPVTRSLRADVELRSIQICLNGGIVSLAQYLQLLTGEKVVNCKIVEMAKVSPNRRMTELVDRGWPSQLGITLHEGLERVVVKAAVNPRIVRHSRLEHVRYRIAVKNCRPYQENIVLIVNLLLLVGLDVFLNLLQASMEAVGYVFLILGSASNGQYLEIGIEDHLKFLPLHD